MLERLSELGAKVAGISPTKKVSLLSNFENETGALPHDYRSLLMHFGGDIEFQSLVVFHPETPSPWTSSDGMDMLEMMYGLTSKYKSQSLLEIYGTYKGRIPEGWIPIGAAPGGNQICIQTGNHKKPAVAFWDHESEVAPGFEPSGDGITLIAKSLSDFIGRLKPEQPPTKAVGKVIVDLKF